MVELVVEGEVYSCPREEQHRVSANTNTNNISANTMQIWYPQAQAYIPYLQSKVLVFDISLSQANQVSSVS